MTWLEGWTTCSGETMSDGRKFDRVTEWSWCRFYFRRWLAIRRTPKWANPADTKRFWDLARRGMR
jgi:hypothetical protein